ncbi:MAG TPA: PAS domain S-box protein, partial [Nitrospiraceae bacterium]|nr:PAS domain S-box protein [Nitrospiraceae bacterium]
TQAELEAARDRYVDFYNFSPTGHLMLDASGTVVEANLRAGALLDANWLELIGQPLAHFVAAEDRDLVYRHCQEALQNGTRQSCEVRLQKKAGKSHWLYLESLAVHEEQGCITRFRTALLDITERKQVEQEQAYLIGDLTRSEQHFQSLFNWIPSAVGISTMPEGRFFDVNEGFTRLTGYTREEVIGRTTLELGLWADPSERAVVLQEIQEQGHLHNREGRLRTKSGEIRSLIVSVHSIQLGSTPCLIYLGHDITERKCAEEALKVSERQFASFMDNLPGFAWIKDPQGRHLYANRLFQESLVKHVDWKEKTAYELWPPEIAAQHESDDQKMLASGAPLQTIESYVQDGEVRHALVSKFPIADHKGMPRLMGGVAVDVTERMRVEEALRESESRFRIMADTAPALIWMSGLDKLCIYFNQVWLDYTGRTLEQELGNGWMDGLHPEDFDRCLKTYGEAFDRREPFQMEYRLRKADGQYGWLLDKGLPRCFLSGEFAGYIGSCTDITERMRAEEALRKSEDRYRALYEDSPFMYFTVNTDGAILSLNRLGAESLGFRAEELIGRSVLSVFHEEDRAAARASFDRSLANPTDLTTWELRKVRKNGTVLWVRETVRLVQDDCGALVMLIACEDITERKRAEEALQASDAFTRAVLNSLSAHVCVLDKEGVIITANDAWREFARRHVDGAFIFGEVSDNYLNHCRHTTAGGTVTGQAILKGVEDVLVGSDLSFVYEYACHLPAEECWFLMRVTPLKDAKGVVISNTDISRRVRMGQALEQHALLLSEKQKELESLAGKLIEAQEEERKRIARELHDDFNQRLAALSVELESLERTPIPPPEPMVRQLAAIRVQAGKLSDDLHDLAYRLHPSLLEHVGLEVAARDNIAEFAKRTGLSVRFTAREVPKTLSSEVATNLFRVMQESLQNVSKHAQATDVTVRLSGSSKGIGLSVRDNGKGFDPKNKNACAKGLGLVSMQERARGLGGFLRIHSLPRNGTKVCAWIPHFQEDA